MELKATDFRLIPALCILCLAAISWNVSPASAEQMWSGSHRVQELRDNAVAITAEWNNGATELGFGFIVGERNGEIYITTANHVVRGQDPDQVATKISVRLRQRPGEDLPARLNGIAPPGLDLAVIVAQIPPHLRWRRDALAPDASRLPMGALTWFIGREGGWYVSDRPGAVAEFNKDTNRIIAKELDVKRGTSGAPLVSEKGIVGMVVDDSVETVSATPIASIEAALRGEGLPWDLYAVEPLAKFKECNACPEMVVIPGGTFQMGSPDEPEYRVSGEVPKHEVLVSAFAAGRYEVTFEEWDRCVADNGCDGYRPTYEGIGPRERRPVGNVSWKDAQLYVEWLSKLTGFRYRLLSEAEWEYAARARTTTRYFWGDNTEDVCKFANSLDQDGWNALSEADKRSSFTAAAKCSDGFAGTSPVGSFHSNGFDLHDMLGNVAEWVEDCGHRDYNGAPTDGSAWVHRDCDSRSARGYTTGNPPDRLYSAHRASRRPDTRSPALGFRVARTLGPT